jgi:site-specific recombinase XerD
VLSAEQIRHLLDSIDCSKLIGLRDRALIGLLVFSFARTDGHQRYAADDQATRQGGCPTLLDLLPHLPRHRITTNLKHGGTLEHAQQIAAHESPRTTKLYDRQVSIDEIEGIDI